MSSGGIKILILFLKITLVIAYLNYPDGKNGNSMDVRAHPMKSIHGCFFNSSHCDSSGLDPAPVIYNVSITLSCDEYLDGNINIQTATYSRPVRTGDSQCDYIECFRGDTSFCYWDNSTCSQDVEAETLDKWQYECSDATVCILEDLSPQSMYNGSCGCSPTCPCLSRTLIINYACTYYGNSSKQTTLIDNLPTTTVTDSCTEGTENRAFVMGIVTGLLISMILAGVLLGGFITWRKHKNSTNGQADNKCTCESKQRYEDLVKLPSVNQDGTYYNTNVNQDGTCYNTARDYEDIQSNETYVNM